MQVTALVYWMPKAGNRDEEYEDSFSIDLGSKRFAIADGASESSFARTWADLLTAGFTRSLKLSLISRPEDGGVVWVSSWMGELQTQWSQSISWETLSWFAREKAESGAFAAFLGLELDETDETGMAQWASLSVGDCLMFLVQDDRLIFPLSVVNFVNTAPLVCSNPTNNRLALQNISVATGKLAHYDRFFLCTDALAQWFLSESFAGSKPWSLLDTIATQQDFFVLVEHLRNRKLVRNDDMTLVRIHVE